MNERFFAAHNYNRDSLSEHLSVPTLLSKINTNNSLDFYINFSKSRENITTESSKFRAFSFLISKIIL